MIALIGIISLVLIALEVILVHKFPLFRRINEHSWASGFLLSITLGVVVGAILGLNGVVVGMSSAISLVVTDTIWGIKRKVLKDTKEGRVSTFTETIVFWKRIFKMFKWVGIVALAPFWVPARIYARMSKTEVPA